LKGYDVLDTDWISYIKENNSSNSTPNNFGLKLFGNNGEIPPVNIFFPGSCHMMPVCRPHPYKMAHWAIFPDAVSGCEYWYGRQK